VIQVASDPLFSGYPIRGFPSDLTLGGAPRLTLEALAEAAARLVDPRAVAERRRLWETEHTRLRQAWAARAKAVSKDAPIDMAWVSRCIADRIDEQTLVVNEYDLDTTQTSFQSPGTYFAASPSSGPRLGARRRARGQARRAGQDADLLRGRRRLHLRLTHRRALGVARP
jgi:acetolactate synthase-1/2/3 large subunit